MLSPNNMAIRQLSQEEGIYEATLHKWRAVARGKGQLLPDAVAGSESWTSRDKVTPISAPRVTRREPVTKLSVVERAAVPDDGTSIAQKPGSG